MEEDYKPNVIVKQQEDRSDLIQVTMPERIARVVEHEFRGERLNEVTGAWFMPVDEENKPLTFPLMNEEGIARTMTFLKLYLNQNLVLSNPSEKRILLIMQKFAEEYTLFVAEHMDKWEIEDETTASMIVNSISDLIFCSYSRAIGTSPMSDKQMIAQSVQKVESTMTHIGSGESEGKKPFFRNPLFKRP